MFNPLIRRYKGAFSGLPREVWMLSLVVLVNRSGTMVLFFLSIYLTEKLGYSAHEAGRFISIYGLGSLSGAFLGGWLSDRIGTKQVQFLSLIFAGAGFIVFGYMKTAAALTIIIYLVSLSAESFRPANMTALAAASPPALRPRTFALNRMAVNIGIAAGPAVGGFLALYNYHLLFWVDGITCLLAAGVLWFAIKEPSGGQLARHKKSIFSGKSPW
ncbi:MAG: MFS transporter [Calditrichia bacterium]